MRTMLKRGGGGGLNTLTCTTAATAVLPAVSRAIAERSATVLGKVRVSSTTSKGAAVTSEPRLAPLRVNCTPATMPSSAAWALIVIEPVTVAPGSGAVIATSGAVVSGWKTMTRTGAEDASLPAVSVAAATRSTGPIGRVSVLSRAWYGGAVTGGPSAIPLAVKLTWATAPSSLASAVIVAGEVSVSPGAGEVIATDGGVTSGPRTWASESV